VNDTAGNVNSTVQEINFDNTPPQIKDSLVGENSNISGSVDINFTLEEANLVTASEFRIRQLYRQCHFLETAELYRVQYFRT